ncbi:MAG: ribonuclease III domain-containing protein [Eubacterium sp.]
MEKGIDSYIRERFGIRDVDIRTYSPLTLAYIGDGIYDLVIRSLVVGKGNTRASELHHRTSHLVKAHSQSAMMEYILPILSEEEEAVYRRGRNAKSPTMAKNATMGDYRRATGFEALMGYLYLKDEFDRMLELIAVGLKGIHAEEAANIRWR